MKVLPLFKSHYSIGRSILTLEKEGDAEKAGSKGGPDSIVDLAKQYNLSQVPLVEDSMTGFLEAYTNLSEAKRQLIFGLRLTMTLDCTVKTAEDLSNHHKVIIFARNLSGYKRLIKISTQASIDGFYYEPRLDFERLRKFWDDKDLQLAIPFYDSFIFNNLILGRKCVPDLTFTTPVFLLENNFLPFDEIVSNAVKAFVDTEYETVPAKSIYYAKREDFKAYLTFRCIDDRKQLEKPNMEHLSSPEFCLESWKECNEL